VGGQSYYLEKLKDYMKIIVLIVVFIVLLFLLFVEHEIKQDKILFPIDADTGE